MTRSIERPAQRPVRRDEQVYAAPISWGVCEAHGWGTQLDPARVLGEMQSAGYHGTELGPEGWIGSNASHALDEFGLRCAGGFMSAVLHDDRLADAELRRVKRLARALRAVGSATMVLAPAWRADGYDERRELSSAEWKTLARSLEQVDGIVGALGQVSVLHPHVGTVVERPDDIERVMRMTNAWCLDTGHLMAGGLHPLDFLELHRGAQILHVHLKDVDGALAAQVAAGDLAFSDAVAQGIFVELGQGDAKVAEVIDRLEFDGYEFDYVIEQDVRLDSAEADTLGPARRNREFVVGVLAEVHS